MVQVFSIVMSLGIAAVALAIAGHWAHREVWYPLRLRAAGHVTQATVVAVEKRDCGGEPSVYVCYDVTVDYLTHEGSSQKAVVLPGAARTTLPTVGETLTVLYEPADPRRAMLADWESVLVMAFGVVPLWGCSGAFALLLGTKALLDAIT
jgi:hypothetical protein